MYPPIDVDAVAEEDKIILAPQPGPQTEFAKSQANTVFFGGAAGGGKSYALGLIFGRDAYLYPGFKGIMFRRTYPQLMGADGLWETSRKIFKPLGGKPREQQMDWRWANGSTVKFSHLQHEKTKEEHQGKQYAAIAFDEVTHFTPTQFAYLSSRSRTTCGIQPYIRATCNSEPGWVADFIEWYLGDDGYAIPERCGVIRWYARTPDDQILWRDAPDQFPKGLSPLSFTFIASDLSDNKILEAADPLYRARLMNLPRVERERLLGAEGKKGGNWRIAAAAGLYFQRKWFNFTTKEPSDVVHWVRGWDKAASKATQENPDPDWTVGVRVGLKADGRTVIDGRNIVRMRGSVREVEEAIMRAANWDGIGTTIAFWQDPGQAGLVDREHMVGLITNRSVQFEAARERKTTYWGPISSQAEQGRVDILVPPDGREPEELRMFLATLENVIGDGKEHDDDVDALARAYYEISAPPKYGYISARTDRSRYTL